MDIDATARRVYLALKDNATAVLAIRAENAALALAVATNPDAAFDLTSSTVNGQTFSGRPTIENGERLALLTKVVFMLDNTVVLPRRARIVF